MKSQTIAVLMPGDMGHAVGRVLRERDHDVITCLNGRSAHTHKLAKDAGLRDVRSLTDIVEEADLILSILPPAAAVNQARAIAHELKRTRATTTYVDCNAVSPQTVREIANIIGAVDIPFIDAGIIGLAPGKDVGPRFYVSGPDLAPMEHLHGQGFDVLAIGPEIGRASALKMAYAGLTKGTWTLYTSVLLAAQKLGVINELVNEFMHSQQAAITTMRARVPFLPADSARWIGEMEEIANTFKATGVTSRFHEGAAEIFRLLAQTPFAQENRETLDTDRTLEAALQVYEKFVPEGG